MTWMPTRGKSCSETAWEYAAGIMRDMMVTDIRMPEEDDIPISAEAGSVADVYDALTSDRVYKRAFSHEKAMQMILDGECGQFNPVLLQCLVNIQDRIGAG